MYRKKRFLVCYDVSINKIRTKIQKKLTAYGIRIQYSNYLCEFLPKELLETRKFCEDIIGKKDTLIWIPMSDTLLEKIYFQGEIKALEEKPKAIIF